MDYLTNLPMKAWWRMDLIFHPFIDLYKTESKSSLSKDFLPLVAGRAKWGWRRRDFLPVRRLVHRSISEGGSFSAGG